MKDMFEITDKIGRKIRLTQRQWSHIMKRHSYMEKYAKEIKETLQIPDKIISHTYDKGYYYKGYKHLKSPNCFILVVVKYLNSKGFVITTYQTDKIK